MFWSGRGDLNSRPPAPKAGALPGCATPRLKCCMDSKAPSKFTPNPYHRYRVRSCTNCARIRSAAEKLDEAPGRIETAHFDASVLEAEFVLARDAAPCVEFREMQSAGRRTHALPRCRA